MRFFDKIGGSPNGIVLIESHKFIPGSLVDDLLPEVGIIPTPEHPREVIGKLTLSG